jgi:class 3 adenylate cyclase
LKRPTLPDAALAALLLPIWLIAFVLHVQRIRDGDLAWIWVYVRPPAHAEAPPVVRWVRPDTVAAASGLQAGDELLAVEDRDLTGMGPAGFLAQTLAAARGRHDVSVRLRRDGTEQTTTLQLTPVDFPWRSAPITIAFVVTGVLVLLRRAGTPLARAFFVAALLYSLHWTFFFGGPAWSSYAWLAVFFAASTLMFPLMLRPVFVFFREAQGDQGPLPRWPWLLSVFGPVSISWVIGWPIPPEIAFPAAFVLNVLWVGSLFWVLARSYPRIGPLARRRVKWVVYGLFVGLAPVLATNLVIPVAQRLSWLHEVAVLAEALIPICIFIAIVRYQMFDVDRLISATTAYTVVSIAAIATVLTVVPQLARASAASLGTTAENAQLFLSLVLAGCIVPAQRLVRPRIERLFFAERHALRRGAEQLLLDLGESLDPESLLRLLGSRLHALLRPTCWAIYGSLDEGFGLLLSSDLRDGQVAPEQLAGPRESFVPGHGPTDLASLRLTPGRSRDQAADLVDLERLGVNVLLPLTRGKAVRGAICLGPKASGDIYTATDRALLSAVADKVSDTLLRFDEAEILQRERAMRDSLQRYVPTSVAERLVSGREVEGGERELAVLFVDVRGYSTYSEGKGASTVFSVINTLTDAVSSVVRRHGGTVVEFLGDGVMAVFGAPEPLPGHARAAVEAGRRIVAAIDSLELSAEQRGERALAVGVGIATGPAFVGNVETEDRLIYTAIGDTVNLASRLQSMTRQLDAAIAIDANTHHAAGDAAHGFEHRGETPVRGRREAADVWVLPLAAPPTK